MACVASAAAVLLQCSGSDETPGSSHPGPGGAAGQSGTGGSHDTSGPGGSTGSDGKAGSVGQSGNSSTDAGDPMEAMAGTSRDSSPDAGTIANAFMIGADITFAQADEARGATYSDGTSKEILQLLKDHGFNYIRLRTFVDPRAADGYDRQQGYADLAHTITFGKRIKAAGMGFLLDFHYSDNWADPGKQCIPVAWQGMNLTQMAQAVRDYTKDAISQLVAAGARPDMVQIGNEITPGMLIHICDGSGRPTSTNAVNGSASNWTNLGTLLKAGVNGVKDVDPSIQIMLHIDRGNAFGTSRSWIDNAITQQVPFDVFGESCYQRYQGDPNSVPNTVSGWTSTFTQLASRYPNVKFVAAEYGPLQREINDVVFKVPGQQGAGTFNWEPIRQGDWNTGHALFSASGNTYTATADLALYDMMKTAYANRL